MPIRPMLVSFSASLITTAVLAQGRIWVVDAANGPGTHFVDLPPAVAAAGPGDTIAVRAGDYTGVRLATPLSIVAAPNARIVFGGPTYAGLFVSNIPAGTTCSIAGLEVRVVNPLEGSASVVSCAGTVLFERVLALGSARFSKSADVRCTQLRSTMLTVDGSAVVLSRCVLDGGPAAFFSSNPALILVNSSVVVSRCTLIGAAAYSTVPNSAAVRLQSADLILTGDGSGAVAAGAGGDRSAIEGTGKLLLDPHVSVVPQGSAPAVAAGVAVTPRAIPSLSALGAPPGGAVDIELFAGSGQPYLLVVGLPAAPLPLPALGGALWLAAPVIAGGGTVPAGMRVGLRVPLPADSLLLGKTFVWQGAAGVGAAVTLSNPATYVHGL